jgi:hypothetical protein
MYDWYVEHLRNIAFKIFAAQTKGVLYLRQTVRQREKVPGKLSSNITVEHVQCIFTEKQLNHPPCHIWHAHSTVLRIMVQQMAILS